ncbi:MAG: hypothetical protein AB2A00_10960 [Myxococcota bacterium]
MIKLGRMKLSSRAWAVGVVLVGLSCVGGNGSGASSSSGSAGTSSSSGGSSSDGGCTFCGYFCECFGADDQDITTGADAGTCADPEDACQSACDDGVVNARLTACGPNAITSSSSSSGAPCGRCRFSCRCRGGPLMETLVENAGDCSDADARCESVCLGNFVVYAAGVPDCAGVTSSSSGSASLSSATSSSSGSTSSSASSSSSGG